MADMDSAEQQTTWQRATPELVELFERAMESLPEAERRKMFGSPCAFTNGYMFSGVHGQSLFLRLEPADRERLLAMEGGHPFAPMPGRAMGEYVVAPPAVMNAPAELEAWLARAFAYARSLPPKQPKPKRKKSAGTS